MSRRGPGCGGSCARVGTQGLHRITAASQSGDIGNSDAAKSARNCSVRLASTSTMARSSVDQPASAELSNPPTSAPSCPHQRLPTGTSSSQATQLRHRTIRCARAKASGRGGDHWDQRWPRFAVRGAENNISIDYTEVPERQHSTTAIASRRSRMEHPWLIAPEAAQFEPDEAAERFAQAHSPEVTRCLAASQRKHRKHPSVTAIESKAPLSR